jgi:IS605 OrfB family transposase
VAKERYERKGKIPSRITFGTKKHYRLKDTTKMNLTEWHEEREYARNHMILFSGRFDAKYKNWLVKYEVEKQEMTITLMNHSVLRIKNIIFPYRGEELQEILAHKKEVGVSVGYWLEVRKDSNGRNYLLMKATITKEITHLNEYIKDGVVAVDLNLDNLSWSELDATGNYVRGGVIEFHLVGKDSHQIDDLLGRACSRVIKHCKEVKKPLILEEIDLRKKKASMSYGKKKANAGTSLFAYSKMSAFLTSKAYRNGIGVLTINPAYTSQIGKLKYMRMLRSTVHRSASYVIGRRGMGFSEKVPTIYKNLLPIAKKRSHHWKQFAHITALIKGIPTNTFRKNLPNFLDKKELETYVRFA